MGSCRPGCSRFELLRVTLIRYARLRSPILLKNPMTRLAVQHWINAAVVYGALKISCCYCYYMTSYFELFLWTSTHILGAQLTQGLQPCPTEILTRFLMRRFHYIAWFLPHKDKNKGHKSTACDHYHRNAYHLTDKTQKCLVETISSQIAKTLHSR